MLLGRSDNQERKTENRQTDKQTNKQTVFVIVVAAALFVCLCFSLVVGAQFGSPSPPPPLPPTSPHPPYVCLISQSVYCWTACCFCLRLYRRSLSTSTVILAAYFALMSHFILTSGFYKITSRGTVSQLNSWPLWSLLVFFLLLLFFFLLVKGGGRGGGGGVGEEGVLGRAIGYFCLHLLDDNYTPC